MKLFKTNQNKAERILRLIVAFFLIPAPLILGKGLYSLILFSVGIILLFNSVVGTCMIYKVLGVNTCKN